MKSIVIVSMCLPLLGQNYASYSTYPVARMSFLRHQFNPAVNAFRDSSLKAYWPLNEGTGNVVYDASGNANFGNWIGTGNYYGRLAKTSQSCSSLTGNYALLNNFPAATSIQTWTSWVNIGSFSVTPGTGISFSILSDQIASDHNPGYELSIKNSNLIWYWPGTAKDVFSTSTVTAGVWQFIAITYNTGSLQFYVNGQSAGTGSSVQQMNSSTANLALFGLSWTTGLGNGSACEVRIYNRALSQTEIQAIYTAENH